MALFFTSDVVGNEDRLLKKKREDEAQTESDISTVIGSLNSPTQQQNGGNTQSEFLVRPSGSPMSSKTGVDGESGIGDIGTTGTTTSAPTPSPSVPTPKVATVEPTTITQPVLEIDPVETQVPETTVTSPLPGGEDILIDPLTGDKIDGVVRPIPEDDNAGVPDTPTEVTPTVDETGVTPFGDVPTTLPVDPTLPPSPDGIDDIVVDPTTGEKRDVPTVPTDVPTDTPAVPPSDDVETPDVPADDVAPLPEGDISGLSQLADLIVNRLNAPNPFGTAEIEALRESGRVEREQQRRAQTAALEADAARRGVFFGTPLTTGLGEMESALQRSADQAERDILQLVAEATERSSQATLDDALQFLGMAGNEQQAMNQLAVAAAQLGQQGGIDPNSALALLMGMGGDAGGIDPNLLAFFGSLFGAPQKETV